MFPSRMTYDVATSRHREHLDHSARIREIRQARRDGALDVDRTAQRRRTAARLTHVLAVARAAFHF